jgi:hypothetical protein
LILPDQSTAILSPPAGQSLGEVVEGVLSRRGEQGKQFLIYLHTGELLDPLLRYYLTKIVFLFFSPTSWLYTPTKATPTLIHFSSKCFCTTLVIEKQNKFELDSVQKRK